MLANAPRELIAAGFGDMLGKYTSIADWRLGRLLWEEPYEESIAERTLAAVKSPGARGESGASTQARMRILGPMAQ